MTTSILVRLTQSVELEEWVDAYHPEERRRQQIEIGYTTDLEGKEASLVCVAL